MPIFLKHAKSTLHYSLCLLTAPEDIIAERLYRRERETEAEIIQRLRQNTELIATCSAGSNNGRQTAIVMNDSTIELAVDQLHAIICNEKLPQTA